MATTNLTDFFLQATEAAAVAASPWRGKGDGKAADGAAVEAMRAVFDKVPFDGRVAIGEGERDDAPMLWIGEPLGSMQGVSGAPRIDIAVDPLECTNHVANNLPNAMAVLAAAPRGSLLHAPDCYMDKIAGSKELLGELSLDAETSYNLESACSILEKAPSELNVVVMDRPRHVDLIRDINDFGSNIIKIGDGDVSAALNAADPESDIDLLMGIGAAPEGVITATAMRGLNATFQGRLEMLRDFGIETIYVHLKTPYSLVRGFVMEEPREWNSIRTAKHQCTQKLLMYPLGFTNSYHLRENSRPCQLILPTMD